MKFNIQSQAFSIFHCESTVRNSLVPCEKGFRVWHSSTICILQVYIVNSRVKVDVQVMKALR